MKTLLIVAALCAATICCTQFAQAGLRADEKALLEYYQKELDGTGQVVEDLPKGYDPRFKEVLQNRLEEGTYDRPYEADVFDCSNMTMITKVKLDKAGFNTKILYRCNVTNNVGHVFLTIEDCHGKFYSVECTGNEDCYGRITTDDRYYSGLMFESSLEYTYYDRS